MTAFHSLEVSSAAGECPSRQWVQARLEAAGAIVRGGVIGIESIGDPLAQREFRLRIFYSDECEGHLPKVLLMKRFGASDDARSEMDFYSRDYRDLLNAPIPRCFASDRLPGRGGYLLLEDISGTYRPTWNLTGSTDLALASARALAVLHSEHWTADPDEGAAISGLGTLFDGVERGLSTLIPRMHGKALEWLCRMDRRLYAIEAAFRSRLGRGHLTRIHGNPSPDCVLADEAVRRVLLLHGGSANDGCVARTVGVSDLVHCLIEWRSSSERRAVEPSMLEAYHESLFAHGVLGYSKDSLWDDYRLHLTAALIPPLLRCRDEDRADNAMVAVTGQVMRVVDALEQHRADELWR